MGELKEMFVGNFVEILERTPGEITIGIILNFSTTVFKVTAG